PRMSVTPLMPFQVFWPTAGALLSPGRTGRLATWSAAGKRGAALDGRPFPVPITSAARSSDGKRMILAGSGTNYFIREAWVVDSLAGKLLRKLEGHGGEVTSVAISPDGEWAATGCHDNKVRLWPVSGAGPGRVLGSHRGSFNTLCFSADGRRLYSGGD